MVRTILVMTFLGLAAPAAEAQRPDSLALARQYTAWFYAGQADSLWAHTHPDMRASTRSEGFYLDRLATLVERAGVELELVEERFRMRNGQPQYWRTATFSEFTDEPILFRWVIVDGMIAGVGVSPLSQAPPVDP
jgi:hypothetical protein